MDIPPPILDFISNKITTGVMMLPFHYPLPQKFESWQSGFRYHGHTGADLTSPEPGEWQPGWYTIALNGLDDPFFVDITESAANYPVYYSQHGAGKWEPVKVSENLARFGGLLQQLKLLGADKAAYINFLRLHTDIANPFWQEVYENVADWDEEETDHTPPHPQEFVCGTLVITNIGGNKLKLISFLKQYLALSPQQALQLAKEPEITVAEGYRHLMQWLVQLLEDLGATVTFKPKMP